MQTNPVPLTPAIRNIVRRTFGQVLGLSALACFGLTLGAGLAGSAAQAQGKVVNIYNWSDYIDPKMLEEFTAETGIKVVYDTYDNNEIVETKLLAGKSGYDIVVPSGPFLQRLIGAKVFQPLDKGKLTNAGNIWPEIAQRLTVYDPGNRHAVNYMWGTTGIGINVKKVRERLGDVPLNTWDLVLKPSVAAKLKDCGIHMLDAPEDIFPGVLAYMGKNGDSKKEEDLRAAADLLMKARGNIRKFHSSEYINALANGDICVAVGYSGDVLQARKRAEEAKNGVDVSYIIPKEGALMWFDSMAIPADAPNAANAHAFIDFMLRPKVAAANTNFVAYASGNNAAKPFVDPAILKNPGVYPDDAAFKRLFTNTSLDDKTQRLVTRLWTRVKTGR
jgi:putrescine transport system substrate-binding protein